MEAEEADQLDSLCVVARELCVPPQPPHPLPEGPMAHERMNAECPVNARQIELPYVQGLLDDASHL